MKTRVYIDGYNLYYGCLKNSPYKWLESTKPQVEGLLDLTSTTPMEALRTSGGAMGVYEHAKAYVEWKLSGAVAD